MTKLEELRNYISDLFQSSQDENVIKQAAVVNDRLEQSIKDDEEKDKKYNNLLNDYKEVVIHSSFKSNNSFEKSATQAQGFFDEEAFDKEYFENLKKEGKN